MSTAQMAALGPQRAAVCMPPGLLRNPTANCSTTHSSNSIAALTFAISSCLCVTDSWPPEQFRSDYPFNPGICSKVATGLKPGDGVESQSWCQSAKLPESALEGRSGGRLGRAWRARGLGRGHHPRTPL